MKYQLLPPLGADELAALEESIAQHGVLVPIEYDEAGEIIDGHHREAICRKLGLAEWPRFVRKGLSETEKRSLSRELNFARRHLSSEQKRGLIADQLRETPTISSRAIAARLGVDDKTVAKVRRQLIETAEIPQFDEVESRDGAKRPAMRAIKTAFVPEPENRRELMRVAKEIRAEQQQTRHQVRLAHMEMVAEKGRATTQRLTRAYPVYYADPPWKFGVRSEVTGREKSAENHYPTMETDAICQLMAELCGGDHPAVLFCWATNPMLPDGLRVMEAAGFAYVHHWIWDKEVAGTGYWGRDRHELLLIGRRGDIAAPLPGTQPETVHRERKGAHSDKPEFFASTISQLYPGIAKVELFARTARPFWDVWGFEAGSSTSSSGACLPPRTPERDAARRQEAGVAPDATSAAPVELSKAENAGELSETAGPRQEAASTPAASASLPLLSKAMHAALSDAKRAPLNRNRHGWANNGVKVHFTGTIEALTKRGLMKIDPGSGCQGTARITKAGKALAS
jgi:N6-adenosine-specific RNA methylase IME4/ParB-like chromosome segregation protein Spo0J